MDLWVGVHAMLPSDRIFRVLLILFHIKKLQKAEACGNRESDELRFAAYKKLGEPLRPFLFILNA